jgi:hypothetical protein
VLMGEECFEPFARDGLIVSNEHTHSGCVNGIHGLQRAAVLD